MAVRAEISMATRRYTAEFGTMARLRTHVGVDVRRHVIFESVWDLVYDVSEKHSEANLQVTWAAVSLSMIMMGVWQTGHNQELVEAASIDRRTGVIPNSLRQSSMDADRWELAMKPKCRMRTKPLGSTCTRKRRMNSAAETIINRCLLPRA